MNALSLKAVSVEGRVTAVDLEIPEGKLVGLVGPNGSGKSTVLSAAAGVLPASGTVNWAGRELATIDFLERGRMAAWVPQEAHFEFGFSVRAVVGQGRFAHGDEEGAVVDAALARFDLNALAERPVNRLSGGERQRVLLARALATAAPLQLWDEPLAALDPRHALEVLQLGSQLSRAGSTVVMSLHDLRLARCLDLVAVMQDGKVRACGRPDDVLTPGLLLEVFGVEARKGEEWILGLP